MRRSFINVNDETAKHDESGDVMKYITNHYNPARHAVGEPHQQSGNQKEQSTNRNHPKVKLLSGIEEADVLCLQLLFVCRIRLNPPHPTAVGRRPRHWSEPVDELKEKEDLEDDAEPWMQCARSRSTPKERSEPTKEPRRIDGKAG